jgi:hypothetical protein
MKKGGEVCYAGGGKIRDIGGIKAPAYGSNPKLIKMAEGRSTGSDRMDGPDGGPSKARLDRSGRKHGGRTKAKG